MSDKLEILSKPYPEVLLDAWVKGDYTMLINSNASEFIKGIIVSKVAKRKGKRFFGEAYIASTAEMVDGWYNSFKWMSANKWITGKGLKNTYEQTFQKALMKYIGKDLLSDLQSHTKALFENHKEKFFLDGVYKKPVAPDLWLIDKDGRFSFIESKLSDDSVGYHQIAGLALLKKYIGTVQPVSVSIFNLYPKGTDPKSAFNELYGMLE